MNQLDEKGKKAVVDSFSFLSAAEALLKRAVESIAIYETDKIPAVNPSAIKMFGETINNIDFYMKGIKSFLSVSALTQLVEASKATT